MANRVPIDDREIVPYLLQGISDPQLRDQARLLKIRTKADLLEAFENLMLRGPVHPKAPNTLRDYGRSHQHQSSPGKSDEDKGRRWTPGCKQRSCYSCGATDHVGHNCPTKGKGVKYFKCQDYGHIASECKSVNKHVKDVNSASEGSRKKRLKEVQVEHCNHCSISRFRKRFKFNANGILY